MWLHGYVAMWLFSYVAKWLCQCGYVAMWLYWTSCSLVSPMLTRPTLIYVHCVPQKGGRGQGWESVFWRGLVVFSKSERFKNLIGQKIPRSHATSKLFRKYRRFFQNICWFNRIYLCLNIFNQIMVRNTKIPRPKIFENARRYPGFWTHHNQKKN